MTNRKSHVSIQLTARSMALNELKLL